MCSNVTAHVKFVLKPRQLRCEFQTRPPVQPAFHPVSAVFVLNMWHDQQLVERKGFCVRSLFPLVHSAEVREIMNTGKKTKQKKPNLELNVRQIQLL